MYLSTVDREIRSFEKTIKSFNKIQAKIQRKSIPSKTGRGMWKGAVIIVSALTLLGFLLPPFRFPTKGEVSSGFFIRKRPESFFALDLETHKGIDLAAPLGTPVLSSAPGRVAETGFSQTYGNYIRVRHLLGFETRYAHLREISVDEGGLILARAFRPIGRVGSTGRSTGPHLHFEVRWFGFAMPPRFFLVFHGIRKAVLGF